MYNYIQSVAQSLLFCVLLSSFLYAKRTKIETQQQAVSCERLMDSMYEYNSDAVITPAESDFIAQKGGNATYGEIKPDSLRKLLTSLAITNNDILYDLGSGTGKVVIQSYLEFPFKKVVGIELSEKRYQQALKARRNLEKRDLITKKRILNFIWGDIAEIPFKDATIIYMCSTCFPNELMIKLAEKFSTLKKGTRIITLKSIPLPSKYNLRLIQDNRFPMSWSAIEGSPVYVYIKAK